MLAFPQWKVLLDASVGGEQRSHHQQEDPHLVILEHPSRQRILLPRGLGRAECLLDVGADGASRPRTDQHLDPSEHTTELHEDPEREEQVRDVDEIAPVERSG